MKEFFKKKYYKIQSKISPHKNDFFGSFLLNQIFHSGSYLPFTTSSLRLRGVACILNDIVINDRKSILELGSGISTILIARLFKLNEIEGKIYSIDQDQNWVSLLKGILRKEKLEKFVEFIYAPVVLNHDNQFGYDREITELYFKDKLFDLVLVDGPAANRKEHKKNRNSNSKIFIEYLSENCSIFIDNSDRKDVMNLVEDLSKILDCKTVTLDSNFSILVKGNYFNFII